VGAVLTVLPSSRPPALTFTPYHSVLAVAFALLAGAAMGVDFPESDTAFARLT
jgi:hypothetical protein